MNIEDKYNQVLSAESSVKDHIPIFRQYASLCSHITELGTGEGFSTWAFLAGCSMVVSIDIIKPQDIELLSLIEFIEADDLTIEINETDLLFIDTHHTYKQLIQELERHGNKSRKYIFLHDTNSYGLTGNDGEEGILKAIGEFLNKNPQWVIKKIYYNCGGLTILQHE